MYEFSDDKVGYLDTLNNSKTSNQNFCCLISIHNDNNQPYSGIMRNSNNVYRRGISDEIMQRTILTSDIISEDLNIYSRKIPYLQFQLDKTKLLETMLIIESGKYYLSVATVTLNKRGGEFFKNGEFMNYLGKFDKNSLVLTGISLLLD